MPLDQFEAYVFWAWGQVQFFRGADPANEARSFTPIDEDFNTELSNFLRRKD